MIDLAMMTGASRRTFGGLAPLLALVAATALPGCPAPPTALARAQQVAQEFNQDARFGRAELTMEHVAPSARDDYAAHHHAWGTGVRIADLEVEGMHARGDHELDVMVRVAWYRPEEQELRTTTVQQTWRDEGGWQLTAERRTEGDIGLLGESVVYQTPAGGAPARQFPTVHLGGVDGPAAPGP
ncbi:MAG TPA: hypothetical protein VGM06_15870 [Polyangiaceae bacterium]|jgi:hypothetical protein